MAIISIPSSIGGITVPGTSTNGPLGLLFNNPFAISNLQYPRDLDSFARGHVVHLTAYDIKPIGYQDDTSYNASTALGAAVNSVEQGLSSSATSLAQNGISATINGVLETAKNGSGFTTSDDLKLSGVSYKELGTISLYMPEDLSFSYAAQYNDVSVTNVITDTIKGTLSKLNRVSGIFGRALTSGPEVLGSDAAKLGLKAAGLAVNPQLQLLFEGIGFREYSLKFTFSPYSQQEADNVVQIVKKIKEWAAPRTVKGAAGAFFIPPAVFQPEFRFNGQKNTKVSAVTKSVVTGIEVNYTPNGWATTNDGSPVQTTLAISFKEIEILDRDKLVKGNY